MRKPDSTSPPHNQTDTSTCTTTPPSATTYVRAGALALCTSTTLHGWSHHTCGFGSKQYTRADIQYIRAQLSSRDDDVAKDVNFGSKYALCPPCGALFAFVGAQSDHDVQSVLFWHHNQIDHIRPSDARAQKCTSFCSKRMCMRWPLYAALSRAR